MNFMNRVISEYQEMISIYDKQPWERSIEKAVSQSLNKLTRKKGKVNNDLIDLDLIRGSSFSKLKPRHSWLSISRKALYRVIFMPLYFKWWRKCTGDVTSIILLILYFLHITSIYIYSTDNITPSDEVLTMSHLLTPFVLYLILALLNTQITSSGSLSTFSSSLSAPSLNQSSSLPHDEQDKSTSNMFFQQIKNQNFCLDDEKKPVFFRQEGGDDIDADDETDNIIIKQRDGVKKSAEELEMTGNKKGRVDDASNVHAGKFGRGSNISRDEFKVFDMEKNKRNMEVMDPNRNNNYHLRNSDGIKKKKNMATGEVDKNEKEECFVKSHQSNRTKSIPTISFHFENDFEQDEEDDEDDDDESYSVMSLLLPRHRSLNMGGEDDGSSFKSADTNSIASSLPSIEGDEFDDDDDVEDLITMPITKSSYRGHQCLNGHEKKPGNFLYNSFYANEMNNNKKPNSGDKPCNAKFNYNYNIKDKIQIKKTMKILNGEAKHRKNCSKKKKLVKEYEKNINNGGLAQKFGLRKRKTKGKEAAFIVDKFQQGSIQYENEGFEVYGDNADDSCDVGCDGGALKTEIVGEDCTQLRYVSSSNLPYKSIGSDYDHSNQDFETNKEKICGVKKDNIAHLDAMGFDDASKSKIFDLKFHSFSKEAGMKCATEQHLNNDACLHEILNESGKNKSLKKTSSYPSFDSQPHVPSNPANNPDKQSTDESHEEKTVWNKSTVASDDSMPNSCNRVYYAIDNKVSSIIWENNEIQKVNLSVLDIGLNIIKKVDKSCLSYDYFILGIFSSLLLSTIPIIFRSYHSWNQLESLITTSNSTDFGAGFQIALGRNWRQVIIILNGVIQRFWLSLMLFFMLAVSERTFYQRLLYAKNFCYLTSLRRARKYRLPHFRLNKVRNIKMWLSVRSFLKRRGPQRSVEVIVSVAFLASVVIISTICIEILQDYGCFLDELTNWEMTVWGLSIGVFLLRFITLGTSINKKYRNFSVLITEQINLYLHMEQKPHKKNELMMANSVLKLAEDLLKEVESPFKVSGFSANPLLYNITKVVVLSAFSAVISELLGFKLKLYKIKIRA